MEIEVKGHSGCTIEVVKTPSCFYLEKSTHDVKYISRLYNQAIKQQKALEQRYQYIRIPEIYSLEKDDSKTIVKMEYVYSKNFIDHFETAGFEQINYFVQVFRDFIEREIEQSIIQHLPYSIVLKKWEDVKRRIYGNKYTMSDNDIDGIVQRANAIIYRNMQDYIVLPVGICHGDLTFSNILFNGNNFYLIDFLDSFIESPIIDMVKLRQDTAYQWSPLMYAGEYDITRLSIVCSKIDKELDSCFSKYEWYRLYYSIFQLLNFFRILQYAHERKVISYLKKSINCILQIS